MTEFKKTKLKELNGKLAEIMISVDSFKDALELWRTGMLSETLTDKRYKSCLTVLSLAMQTLLRDEIEMQELIELISKED